MAENTADEDVAIEFAYSVEENLECSMDELVATGYQPEPDDSSSDYVA